MKDSQENEKTIQRHGKNICKDIINKRLLAKMYKELLKFKYMKTSNPIKNEQETQKTPLKVFAGRKV